MSLGARGSLPACRQKAVLRVRCRVEHRTPRRLTAAGRKIITTAGRHALRLGVRHVTLGRAAFSRRLERGVDISRRGTASGKICNLKSKICNGFGSVGSLPACRQKAVLRVRCRVEHRTPRRLTAAGRKTNTTSGRHALRLGVRHVTIGRAALVETAFGQTSGPPPRTGRGHLVREGKPPRQFHHEWRECSRIRRLRQVSHSGTENSADDGLGKFQEDSAIKESCSP
jgi:hypothetical protein